MLGACLPVAGAAACAGATAPAAASEAPARMLRRVRSVTAVLRVDARTVSPIGQNHGCDIASHPEVNTAGRRFIPQIHSALRALLLRRYPLRDAAAHLHHHLDGIVDAFARVFDRGRQVLE